MKFATLKSARLPGVNPQAARAPQQLRFTGRSVRIEELKRLLRTPPKENARK
jgi:hypothetical protein